MLSLVIVTLAASFASNLAYAAIARRYRPEARFAQAAVSKERFTEMWRFGVVAFTTRSASTLAVQAGPVIAMLLLGPVAVGVYSIATQLTQNCQRLVIQLGEAIYPSVMKLGGVGDKEGLRTIFQQYSRYTFLIALLLYLGVLVFAGDFIALWVGRDFESAVPVVRILAIAELAALFASTAGLTLLSLGKLRVTLSLSMAEAIGIVFFSLLFVGPFGLGLPGLALGFLVPTTFARVAAYPMLAARAVDTSYRLLLTGIGWRVAVVGSLTLAVLYGIREWVGTASWPRFILAISAASIVYGMFAVPMFLSRKEVAGLFRAVRLIR
jgi:O-antigen/teichoic acid export membrane protein